MIFITSACTASKHSAAEAINSVVDPPSTGGFLLATSASGDAPATHYLCGWNMTDDQYVAWKNERTARITAGDITTDDLQYFEDDRNGVLSELGLSIITLPT